MSGLSETEQCLLYEFQQRIANSQSSQKNIVLNLSSNNNNDSKKNIKTQPDDPLQGTLSLSGNNTSHLIQMGINSHNQFNSNDNQLLSNSYSIQPNNIKNSSSIQSNNNSCNTSQKNNNYKKTACYFTLKYDGDDNLQSKNNFNSQNQLHQNLSSSYQNLREQNNISLNEQSQGQYLQKPSNSNQQLQYINDKNLIQLRNVNQNQINSFDQLSQNSLIQQSYSYAQSINNRNNINNDYQVQQQQEDEENEEEEGINNTFLFGQKSLNQSPSDQNRQSSNLISSEIENCSNLFNNNKSNNVSSNLFCRHNNASLNYGHLTENQNTTNRNQNSQIDISKLEYKQRNKLVFKDESLNEIMNENSNQIQQQLPVQFQQQQKILKPQNTVQLQQLQQQTLKQQMPQFHNNNQPNSLQISYKNSYFNYQQKQKRTIDSISNNNTISSEQSINNVSNSTKNIIVNSNNNSSNGNNRLKINNFREIENYVEAQKILNKRPSNKVRKFSGGMLSGCQTATFHQGDNISSNSGRQTIDSIRTNSQQFKEDYHNQNQNQYIDLNSLCNSLQNIQNGNTLQSNNINSRQTINKMHQNSVNSQQTSKSGNKSKSRVNNKQKSDAKYEKMINSKIRSKSLMDKVRKGCQNKEFIVSLVQNHVVCCPHFRKDLDQIFC